MGALGLGFSVSWGNGGFWRLGVGLRGSVQALGGFLVEP